MEESQVRCPPLASLLSDISLLRLPGGSTILFKIQLLEILSAGIGGGPSLLGADGRKLDSSAKTGGLLGADGKPLS